MFGDVSGGVLTSSLTDVSQCVSSCHCAAMADGDKLQYRSSLSPGSELLARTELNEDPSTRLLELKVLKDRLLHSPGEQGIGRVSVLSGGSFLPFNVSKYGAPFLQVGCLSVLAEGLTDTLRAR